MEEEREEMIDAGCDGFIAKPIDTREFPKAVARFLQNSKKGGGNEDKMEKRQEEDTGS